VSVDNDLWDDVADIFCSRSNKRFARELLEMDKEAKRLAVLEASDQERLMRQEAEDMESGGDSERPEEYSDTRSAATDSVIYHRLLDSLDALRNERERILEERTQSLDDLISREGGSVVVVPETQEERGRKPVRIAIQDGQVLSDSNDEEDGDTPFPRGGAGARLDLGGADGSGALGRIEGAKRAGVPSFLDVFSPRMVLAGFPPGPGLAGTGASPQTKSGGDMEGDAEEDYKGMDYDTDLAEEVYYYILGATQPWTVGRIFQAATKKFTGTDQSALHATIVATLVTMRKTAQHVLMLSIRAGPPSLQDPAILVYLDLSQVEFYQGGTML